MGTSASRPSLETLVNDANRVKALPNAILETIFSNIAFSDMLKTQTPQGCASFVFLTKKALDELFDEIKVEPNQESIYFAPVQDLTMTRQDPESRAIYGQQIKQRTERCMNVSFFYIRTFQIWAALALTTLDTYPARRFGVSSSFGSSSRPGLLGTRRPRLTKGGHRTTRRIPLQHGGAAKGAAVPLKDKGNILEKKLPYIFYSYLIRKQTINNIIYIVNYSASDTIQKDEIIQVTDIQELEDGQLIRIKCVYRYKPPSITLSTVTKEFTIDFKIESTTYSEMVKGTMYIYEEGSSYQQPLQGISFDGRNEDGTIRWDTTQIDNTTLSFISAAIYSAVRPPQVQQAAISTAVQPIDLSKPAPVAATAAARIPFQPPSPSPSALIPSFGSQITSEYVGLPELEKRLLKEKAFPKAYAVARAMQLLNPMTYPEITKTTQFTSDVCRRNTSPMDFDMRASAMPMPGSRSSTNLYFRSLVALYYDEYTITETGQIRLSQSPPDRDALYKASLQLGKLFQIPGTDQDQARFLFTTLPIPAQEVCVSQQQPRKEENAIIEFDLRDQVKEKLKDYRDCIASLRAVCNALLQHQAQHNKEVMKLLEYMFGKPQSKAGIQLNPALYAGGTKAIIDLSRKVRAMLLNYYVKSEALYVRGTTILNEYKKKGIVVYRPL